jgi:hypothetical protein
MTLKSSERKRKENNRILINLRTIRIIVEIDFKKYIIIKHSQKLKEFFHMRIQRM